MSNHLSTPAARVSRGFTLVELLVVIGIIVLLIAILLPALASVKKQGYETRTRAQLQGIGNGIDAYYTLFNAYPGPVKESDIVAQPTQFTAAQNLALGISRRWQAPPAGNGCTAGVKINNVSPALFYDPTPTDAPQDNSQTPARTYAAQYNASDKEIQGGTTWGLSSDAPVFVDRFPEAMPILYYRKTPGVDKVSGASAPPLVVAAGSPNPAPPFYMASNQAFTGVSDPSLPSPIEVPIKAVGGNIYYQSVTSLVIDNMLRNSSTSTPVGGWVLISAGYDHMYGPATYDSSLKRMRSAFVSELGTLKTDDIVVSGGQ